MKKVQDRRVESASVMRSDPEWVHYLTWQGANGYYWFCIRPDGVYYALVDALEPNGCDDPGAFNIMHAWCYQERQFVPSEGTTAYLERLLAQPEAVILEATL